MSTKKITIYFIHRFPFNKEAFIRDEFTFLEEQGFTVRYLDVSNLLKKKKLDVKTPEALQPYVISFNSRARVFTFLKQHPHPKIIVSDVGLLGNSAWLFLAIFKSKTPFVLFENSVLPSFGGKGKTELPKWMKAIKRINLTKVLYKPIDILQLLRAKAMGVKAPLIITSKEKLSTEKRNLLGDTSEIVKTVTLDYRIAQQVPDKPLVDEKYAVFIDQYFVHHPDFKTNYIIHHFTADAYYSELNAFLKAFQQQTGLQVVIANHPRRTPEQNSDFDASFQLFSNQTAHLVKHANMVLHHFSTAVNFMVIFQKPFILLDSKHFNNSSVQEGINRFSSYFKQNAVFMSDTQQLNNLVEHCEVNHKLYAEFEARYIKHPDASELLFRDILVQHIAQTIH